MKPDRERGALAIGVVGNVHCCDLNEGAYVRTLAEEVAKPHQENTVRDHKYPFPRPDMVVDADAANHSASRSMTTVAFCENRPLKATPSAISAATP